MKVLSILFLVLTIQFQSLAQGIWHNYNSTNGLFDNHVKSIEGDYVNNIWIGMGSGSVGDGIDKFDGLAWTHYDTSNSALTSNAIRQIRSDKNGNIWICFFGGFVNSALNLTKFDGASWLTYHTANSDILSNNILDIQIDKHNNIWTSSHEGFFANSYTGVYDLVIDNNDNVWVSTRCEGLYKFDGNTWERIQGLPYLGCSFEVAVDKGNNVWFSEQGSGVWTNKTDVARLNEKKGLTFNIYPNPSNNDFFIKHNLQAEADFCLNNLMGTSVFNKTIQPELEETRIHDLNLDSGIYFWKISQKNMVVGSGKIVIQKN